MLPLGMGLTKGKPKSTSKANVAAALRKHDGTASGLAS